MLDRLLDVLDRPQRLVASLLVDDPLRLLSPLLRQDTLPLPDRGSRLLFDEQKRGEVRRAGSELADGDAGVVD